MEVFPSSIRPPRLPTCSCRLLPVCLSLLCGQQSKCGETVDFVSYTGSAGRVNASRMMTSCGQRSRNVLTVFSLLFPAGKTSVGLSG